MFQRREGTVGFKQGRDKFGRKVRGDLLCTVLNNGFETGDFTDWYAYAGTGAGTVTVEEGGAAEGDYYAKLYHPSGDYFYRIEQTITCDPIGLNIHFQYRTAPLNGDQDYWVQMWDTTSGFIWIPAGQTTWAIYDEPLPPPPPDYPSSFKLRFYTNNDYLGPAVLDIDDVYFH